MKFAIVSMFCLIIYSSYATKEIDYTIEGENCKSLIKSQSSNIKHSIDKSNIQSYALKHLKKHKIKVAKSFNPLGNYYAAWHTKKTKTPVNIYFDPYDAKILFKLMEKKYIPTEPPVINPTHQNDYGENDYVSEEDDPNNLEDGTGIDSEDFDSRENSEDDEDSDFYY